MINIDHVTGENIKELNSKWHQIPYYPNRILITGIFGSTKTNALLNLISHQLDFDKICQ